MKAATVVILSLVLSGCTAMPPLKLAEKVDLPRFMGDWYVIANIPTFLEKGAHNAVESYRLEPDGRIATTFTFRQGAFDGEPRRYTPTGFVVDRASNAVWGMQFVWPIKADYRILYVAADYGSTVIAREKRDYAWIMARTPSIPEAQYRRLLGLLAEQGYDISKVQKVPQRWN
ncbi:MAG TPA: lipocalin family protein [Burkholderiales bacterium]|nr:lipocalin family protein [Burkholderiales bacterium]